MLRQQGWTAEESRARSVDQNTGGQCWWTGLAERHCMEAEGSEVCSLLPRMGVRGSQAGTLKKKIIFNRIYYVVIKERED